MSGQGAGAVVGVSLLGLGLDHGACREGARQGQHATPGPWACAPRAGCTDEGAPWEVAASSALTAPACSCQTPGVVLLGEEASSLLRGSWSCEETGGSAGSPCARLSAPLMVVAADRPPEEAVSRAVDRVVRACSGRELSAF